MNNVSSTAATDYPVVTTGLTQYNGQWVRYTFSQDDVRVTGGLVETFETQPGLHPLHTPKKWLTNPSPEIVKSKSEILKMDVMIWDNVSCGFVREIDSILEIDPSDTERRTITYNGRDRMIDRLDLDGYDRPRIYLK